MNDQTTPLTALELLKTRRCWVAWKYVPQGNGKKPKKIPINPHTGQAAAVDNPATWGSYDEVMARKVSDGLAGPGYVLTEHDGLSGGDTDGVRNAATGELEPWVKEIVDFAETYCEVSPSGTGLRFFWKGKVPEAIKNDPQQVEIYGTGRYLTFTGQKLDGCPDEIREAPRTLAALVARAKVITVTGNGLEDDEDDRDDSNNDYAKLNTFALKNSSAWVPELFGADKVRPYKGGYRVKAKHLNRGLEEDIGIIPKGIVDFGVADQGEPRKGKRGAIGLVMEWGNKDFNNAVTWLCDQLGVPPPDQGVTLEDFFAYMPKHEYIYAPTGEMWPATSVNGRLRPIPVRKRDGTPALDDKGKPKYTKPSMWLDRHRPVEQMTWAPGEPKVVKGRLMSDGGWFERRGITTFNLYRPPIVKPGNAAEAGRWVDLVRIIYPDDANHLIPYWAHCIQKPSVKINHGLLLGGSTGIGKDTMLEALKYGVGAWNFREVSPQDIMGDYNDYMRSVVLRISETRDLGEVNRYSFHEHMKTITASPPDVIRVNGKYIPQHYVLNVTAVIQTTNHRYDAIYLPSNDRRTYVAWSEIKSEDFEDGFWLEFWEWYGSGGLNHVVAYLREYDLAAFNPKAPPRKTPAFWQIVGAGAAPEEAELEDALDRLGTRHEITGELIGRPVVVTLAMVVGVAASELGGWLMDRRNRRSIPHRFESCGYVPVLNPDARDGYWVIGGKRQAVYGKNDVAPADQVAAIRALVAGPSGVMGDGPEDLSSWRNRRRS